MAATLTQLRSRLLLPAEAPEATAALSEAEAWRQKLIAKEEMLAAADWLEQRPQLGSAFFARERPESRSVSRGADITDLLHACLTLLHVSDEVVATYRPRPPVFWRVSQAIARIEELLAEKPGETSFNAFLPAAARAEVGREGAAGRLWPARWWRGLSWREKVAFWSGRPGHGGRFSLEMVQESD